jgi:hypothetical protein
VGALSPADGVGGRKDPARAENEFWGRGLQALNAVHRKGAKRRSERVRQSSSEQVKNKTPLESVGRIHWEISGKVLCRTRRESKSTDGTPRFMISLSILAQQGVFVVRARAGPWPHQGRRTPGARPEQGRCVSGLAPALHRLCTGFGPSEVGRTPGSCLTLKGDSASGVGHRESISANER